MINLEQTFQCIEALKEGLRLRQAQVMHLDAAMDELVWFRENFDEMRKMTDKAEIADLAVEMLNVY